MIKEQEQKIAERNVVEEVESIKDALYSVSDIFDQEIYSVNNKMKETYHTLDKKIGECLRHLIDLKSKENFNQRNQYQNQKQRKDFYSQKIEDNISKSKQNGKYVSSDESKNKNTSVCNDNSNQLSRVQEKSIGVEIKNLQEFQELPPSFQAVVDFMREDQRKQMLNYKNELQNQFDLFKNNHIQEQNATKHALTCMMETQVKLRKDMSKLLESQLQQHRQYYEPLLYTKEIHESQINALKLELLEVEEKLGKQIKNERGRVYAVRKGFRAFADSLDITLPSFIWNRLDNNRIPDASPFSSRSCFPVNVIANNIDSATKESEENPSAVAKNRSSRRLNSTINVNPIEYPHHPYINYNYDSYLEEPPNPLHYRHQLKYNFKNQMDKTYIINPNDILSLQHGKYHKEKQTNEQEQEEKEEDEDEEEQQEEGQQQQKQQQKEKQNQNIDKNQQSEIIDKDRRIDNNTEHSSNHQNEDDVEGKGKEIEIKTKESSRVGKHYGRSSERPSDTTSDVDDKNSSISSDSKDDEGETDNNNDYSNDEYNNRNNTGTIIVSEEEENDMLESESDDSYDSLEALKVQLTKRKAYRYHQQRMHLLYQDQDEYIAKFRENINNNVNRLSLDKGNNASIDDYEEEKYSEEEMKR